MATTFFHDAHDVQVGEQTFNVANNIYFSSAGRPLNQLASRIAAGAIHDSAERCDAPKCHPNTRVAVQDDLYSWILDGDGASEHPKKIRWVTGPAGTGKTAVMGSLSERCKTGGVLAATFFFASWSASIGRRRKTALVTTIAHQLTRYHPELQEEISKAIDANSDIFDKNLHTQMEVLVLTPLQKIARSANRPGMQGAIIIDGLDECEAEQYHESSSTSSQGKPERRNAEDQREILQVLQAASLDPSFPFRIIIASRPERVFREFFDPENNDNATTFAQKLDLHEDYNADADITLFFQAQFNQIRRRYDLPSSWPPPEAFETLVANASGQFIYAATVIRFLDAGHREPPEVLLEAALKMHSAARKIASNPLEQLDALYIHILKSSPDPPLSVLWIHSIHKLNNIRYSYASNIELLLRADPETPSSEVQHLLGNLHSLIRAPHPGNQSITQYAFYHRSLFDFLDDPDRCRELYVEKREIDVCIWDGFIRVCASEFPSASASLFPSL